MDEITFATHLAAGKFYGQDATCGPADKPKIDYKNREAAEKAASAMNAKPNRTHELEAYPCCWCNGWHIGREMTVEEYRQFRPE